MNAMKKMLLLLLVLSSFHCLSQQSLQDLLDRYNTRSVPYISVTELRMLQMNDSITILDAREPEEFQVSHIPNSIFIGFSNFDEEQMLQQLPNTDTRIVVYCSLGIRSEQISEKLKKAGYTQVENLYGGIFEWMNANYPVVDETGEETEDIHGFSKHWSQWLEHGNIILKN